jgi:alkaline phosphatase D
MINRRDFLKATVVFAGSLYLGGCQLGFNDNEDESFSHKTSKFFPQSIASGDPQPDSVILWTRVFDEDKYNLQEDLTLKLQISKDKNFNQIITLDNSPYKTLTARFDDDYCVKVKIKDLEPNSYYYYRFIYEKDGKQYVSNTGRTKTAPSPDEDVKVKFGIINCQDYVGRYYNNYISLLEEDIDFIVNLGDYIYETVPKNPATQRTVIFSETEQAIDLGDYLAANSLSNYRDLYKTYKSDPVLQKLHENFPMISIWDDHEFSDDCWQDNANYTGGRKDEKETQRKNNSIKAWFEYLPTDFEDKAVYDPSQPFPDNIKIYRDFKFGKHLHMIFTDERTYRADHLIPEDAFPGTVILDKPTLIYILGSDTYNALKSKFFPYVDVDEAPYSAYKPALIGALTQGYINEGLSPTDAQAKATDAIKGKILSVVLFDLLSKYNQSVPDNQKVQIPDILIPGTDEYNNNQDRGVGYLLLGKTKLFADGGLGARYFVVKDTFDLYSGYKYTITGKQSENMFGTEQENWFLTKLSTSNSTWKVWGNEFMFMPLIVDLSGEEGIPEQFKQKFYVNTDSWGGFPSKRKELLAQIAQIPNTVIITGDIHSFFAGENEDQFSGNKVPEFVVGSASSATIKSETKSTLNLIPEFKDNQKINLLLDFLDIKLPEYNPYYKFASTKNTGYAVAEVNGEEFKMKYVMLPEEKVLESFYNKKNKLKYYQSTKEFKVELNTGEITPLSAQQPV